MPIDPKNLAGTATLTFSDEFDSLSIWNGSGGTWSTNAWWKDAWELTTSNGYTLDGNGEQQWYINDNYAPTSSVNPWAVSGGVLTITAAPASPEIQALINGYAYTSGQINSYHSFSQEYGYFEMRAQLPAGQGLWPAFWLMPKDGSWPPELDVMEVLGDETTQLHNAAHSMASGEHTAVGGQTTVADMSAGYHTYGVDWEQDSITWYFDGRQVAHVATPADMHKPMYLIANLAVGGYWPGSADASTPFPAQLRIDYIRAYAGDGATQASPAGPATAQAAAMATDGADLMLGGEGADSLSALSGNDSIAGGGGDDYLRGGSGDDALDGGAGFDDINGNEGADTASGGAGADWVVGGKDGDRLSGDDGDDIVYGNLGADTCEGGAGADLVRGGQGADSLNGGPGDDWLSGDRGDDTIAGGAGADTFHSFSDAGVDRIVDFNGGEGDRIQLDRGTAFSLRQAGADAVIDMGAAGLVVLVGVAASSMAPGWIVEV